MNRHLSLVLLALAAISTTAWADDPPPYFSIYDTGQPGYAYGFGAFVTRSGGSTDPLQDFTIGAQFSAENGAGVNQWVFGAATEAWAAPGSQSVLVGFESSVINREPNNFYPKVANNAVMKNRADDDPDPGAPLNANSIAYWITAQPGTGFERGLVFDTYSLAMPTGRAAAIDLSDLSDDQIGQIDLIRIRKDVALRYDPVSKQLVLHVDTPAEQQTPAALRLKKTP